MSNARKNALFLVTGGVPLSGEIIAQGNKNEALPVPTKLNAINKPYGIQFGPNT